MTHFEKDFFTFESSMGASHFLARNPYHQMAWDLYHSDTEKTCEEKGGKYTRPLHPEQVAACHAVSSAALN
jgi:hypothetical protein